MNEGEHSVKLGFNLGFFSGEMTRTLRGSWRRKFGPFVIINRSNGLALDTGRHEHSGAEPIMWHPHGELPQLWIFMRTPHWGEYTIVSVANGLALDAGTTGQPSRSPHMEPRHGEPRQRWRFRRSEDDRGYIISSVLTNHVLDFPHGTKELDRPHMYYKHGDFRQQFLVTSLTSGRFAEGG